METRLKFYSGLLVGCRNGLLLKYPDEKNRELLKNVLKEIVEEAGFGVVNVHIDDYGAESGPGITILLTESHLIVGGWPEKDNAVDFLVYFCERGENNNDEKAERIAEILKSFSGAEEVVISSFNASGPVLLHKF